MNAGQTVGLLLCGSAIFLAGIFIGWQAHAPQKSEAVEVQTSLQQQKLCSDQAAKFFAEGDYRDIRDMKYDYQSHLNPKTGVCAIAVALTMYGNIPIYQMSVHDAFEHKQLAGVYWTYEADLKTEILRDCWVTDAATKCGSQAEWMKLIEVYTK